MVFGYFGILSLFSACSWLGFVQFCCFFGLFGFVCLKLICGSGGVFCVWGFIRRNLCSFGVLK